MPTYHYRCKSCRHEFEELEKMSDPPLVVCPECHKHSLSRLIGGGTGLVFKGSGFYITDYKEKKPSGASSAGTKSESKKDHKPEEKNSDSPKKK